MARVTVEDCLEHVDNIFELVITASERARKISVGSVEPCVPWDNDKPTVIALREIATGALSKYKDEEPATIQIDQEKIIDILKKKNMSVEIDEDDDLSE